jgi:plastocyanin domain-containing protein
MKSIILSILILASIVGLGFLLFKNPSIPSSENASTVTVKDGKQFIEITAKGGYSPKTSNAKAGLPTILRVKTSRTFDCSSAIRLPSLNISENLPASAVTDIDLGVQQAGILPGTCAMGMYNFEINFQ